MHHTLRRLAARLLTPRRARARRRAAIEAAMLRHPSNYGRAA